eukprot:4775344-Alexandrium_andersonii.AAC.1
MCDGQFDGTESRASMCWQHAFDILIHGGPGLFWWHLAEMAGRSCIELDPGGMARYFTGSRVRR